MRVIVPFTNDETVQHQAMLLNLRIHGVTPEMYRMHRDTSYAELFNILWDQGSRFIINEHDVLAPPGALDEIWDCPYEWCGYGDNLQCTKFIPDGRCPVPLATHWAQVDRQVAANLTGFHEHQGTVINLTPALIPIH